MNDVVDSGSGSGVESGGGSGDGSITLFLPFGPIAGDTLVNDQSFRPIELNPGFPFYGRSHNSVYISTDGLLSFGSNFTNCCPEPFPISSPPLVAPFWRDVDITRGGSVYYRIISGSNELLQGINLAIRSSFGTTFSASYVLVVTWVNVTPPLGDLRNNTFQAILATDGIQSYIVFIYGDMQWSEGAEVGFNSGFPNFNDSSFFSIASVNGLDSFGIQRRTNVPFDIEGLYLYRVDVTPTAPPSIPTAPPGSGSGSGGNAKRKPIV